MTLEDEILKACDDLIEALGVKYDFCMKLRLTDSAQALVAQISKTESLQQRVREFFHPVVTPPPPVPPTTPPPVVPVPPIIPPVPTNLIVPTIARNMTRTDFVWRSELGWTKSIAALEFHRPEIKYGSLVTVRFKRRASYPKDGNWKWFRVWKKIPGSIGYPNFYIGQDPTGWKLMYVEKLPVISEVTRKTISNYPTPSEEWRDEEIQWQVNSKLGASDGHIKITVNGQVLYDIGGWRFDDAANPGPSDYIIIQDDPSNHTPPDNSWVEYKDITIEVK